MSVRVCGCSCVKSGKAREERKTERQRESERRERERERERVGRGLEGLCCRLRQAKWVLDYVKFRSRRGRATMALEGRVCCVCGRDSRSAGAGVPAQILPVCNRAGRINPLCFLTLPPRESRQTRPSASRGGGRYAACGRPSPPCRRALASRRRRGHRPSSNRTPP